MLSILISNSLFVFSNWEICAFNWKKKKKSTKLKLLIYQLEQILWHIIVHCTSKKYIKTYHIPLSVHMLFSLGIPYCYCIICRNLPLKGFSGMWLWIMYYDRFWETFPQDVWCDGTDILEDIDMEVRVHIQSIVPTLEQFHYYIYKWRLLFCCFIFILIK